MLLDETRHAIKALEPISAQSGYVIKPQHKLRHKLTSTFSFSAARAFMELPMNSWRKLICMIGKATPVICIQTHKWTRPHHISCEHEWLRVGSLQMLTRRGRFQPCNRTVCSMPFVFGASLRSFWKRETVPTKPAHIRHYIFVEITASSAVWVF